MYFPANQFTVSYFHVFNFLHAYNNLPGCRHVIVLHQEYMRHHYFGLSGTIFLLGCVPQELNSGEFHGHHIESLLGSPVPFSVHIAIIITNLLINQAISYYVITNFHSYILLLGVITLDLGSASI